MLQEQKIQKELYELNARERADIAKERGEPIPDNPYQTTQQRAVQKLTDDYRTGSAPRKQAEPLIMKRRDPNARYQPVSFDPPNAPPNQDSSGLKATEQNDNQGPNIY